jgi:hypothetical protein
MKLMCRHCHATIAHICPFCGLELSPARVRGFAGTHLVCEGASTQIYFSIAAMKTKLTTCEACQSAAAELLRSIAENEANRELQADVTNEASP